MSKEWPKVSLGELLRLERRPVKVEPDKLYQEIGIFCFGRGIFHKAPRTGFEVGAKDLFLMKEGDFILQVTFAWEGAIAIVSAAEDGMHGSTRYPTFRADERRCVPHFLLNYFKTEEGLQQLVKICPGSAGRNRVLSIKRIPEVLVPLPPLSDQLRVVARVKELAAQIYEARTLRHQAAEETEALLVSHSRMLFDSPHRAEWAKMRIVDACEAMIDYRGRTPPISESGIPHLTSANIKGGRINWQTSKFVTNETYAAFMTRGIPRPQDVLFTMEAPLAEVGVVPDTRKFSLAQRVILLRPKLSVLVGEFLARSLSSPGVREDIFSKATATTVSGIASKRLKEVRIPVPPLPEQRRIVSEMNALQMEVDALKRLQTESATELDALLPAILDKAFKGEL